MIKLFHNSFNFIFSIYVDAILLLWFINSQRENYKCWWLLFGSLVKETYLERRRIIELFLDMAIFVEACVWILLIKSCYHIPVFHLDLNTEQKSCLIRFEVKMIATVKLRELLQLIMYVIHSFDLFGWFGDRCSMRMVLFILHSGTSYSFFT